MFDFSKVRQSLLDPHIKKFTFNYCILSTLNIFPKEINIVILELQFYKMIQSLITVEEDEKLSVLLQIVGMHVYDHKDDANFVEDNLIQFIISYLSALIINHPIPINFDLVGKTLKTNELIDEYHNVDKKYLKVKKELLPIVKAFTLTYQKDIPFTVIVSNMKGMLNTKKKYLEHLIIID